MLRAVRALLLFTVLAAMAACGGSSDDAAEPAAEDDVTVASGPDSPDCPVRNHLASEYNGRTRGGVETPVDYAFLEAQRGGCHPVRYNPCEPIHYVVNSTLAPAGVLEDLREAIGKVETATGITFVDDGPTDETASNNRTLSQARYGNRWAPVLIGWQSEAENPALAGDVVGQGGSIAVSLGDGVRVYVTGTVSLDGPQLAEILEARNGQAMVEAVVLHELGHLVGLAHVKDSEQLMYPAAQRDVTDFAAGDRTGLTRLGSGPCVPEL